MDYLSKLSDIELDAIGLERENNEVNIKIPDGKCAWSLLLVGPKRKVKMHSKYSKNP